MSKIYSKIKNPLTNRYININSKLGKKILFNYLKQLGGVIKGKYDSHKKDVEKKTDLEKKLIESKKKREEKITKIRKESKNCSISTKFCSDKVSNVNNIFSSGDNLRSLIENLESDGTRFYTVWKGERYFHNGEINILEKEIGSFSYVQELIFEKDSSNAKVLPRDKLDIDLSEGTLLFDKPSSSISPTASFGQITSFDHPKQVSIESTASFGQIAPQEQPKQLSIESTSSFDKGLLLHTDSNTSLMGLFEKGVSHNKSGSVLSSIAEEIELNDKIERISILEKVSKIDKRYLDEVILYSNKKFSDINKICPNIIPIKNIDGRIFMLKGDGTLLDMTNIDIDTADKIIKCLEETLICLHNNGFYYFDLKSPNVAYSCVNNNLLIWLIDLGSVLSVNLKGVLDKKFYISTLPHPIINSKLFNYDKSILSNCVSMNLLPYNFSIYAYQLSSLFFELIGIDAFIGYRKIDRWSTANILEELERIQGDINKIKDLTEPEKNKIMRYYSVFTDIIDDLKNENKVLNTCSRHVDFYNRI